MPGRFDRYHEISLRLFDILGDFSPLVEPISVDEAFVDLTGTERLHGLDGNVEHLLLRFIELDFENLLDATGAHDYGHARI